MLARTTRGVVWASKGLLRLACCANRSLRRFAGSVLDMSSSASCLAIELCATSAIDPAPSSCSGSHRPRLFNVRSRAGMHTQPDPTAENFAKAALRAAGITFFNVRHRSRCPRSSGEAKVPPAVKLSLSLKGTRLCLARAGVLGASYSNTRAYLPLASRRVSARCTATRGNPMLVPTFAHTGLPWAVSLQCSLTMLEPVRLFAPALALPARCKS